MRNRSRRRLREIVRQRMTYIPPGYDIVFIARPRLVTATHAELVQAVEDVLRRARLWHPHPSARVEHAERGEKQ